MKLLRYGPVGEERPALLDELGEIRDLSAHIEDISGKFYCLRRCTNCVSWIAPVCPSFGVNNALVLAWVMSVSLSVLV